MTRSSIPPALLELRNPSTPSAQITALRDLKNEIVGHDQRKEMAVRSGVVGPLVRILSEGSRRVGKRNGGGVELNGSATRIRGGEARIGGSQEDWSAEDEMRLQAVLVVGSLALGGPAFVTPLLAGNILPPLLDSLVLRDVPSKLIVATLRTIITIADAVALDRSWTETADGPLRPSASTVMASQLYTKTVVESFAEILVQPHPSMIVHQEISLTVQLITKTCQDDRQRNLLLGAGVLDVLATKVAVMAASGDVTLRAIGCESRHQSREALPIMYLPDILEAICAIVKGSNYRTARFLYSEPITEIFPTSSKSSGAGEIPNLDGHASSQGADRFLPRLQAVANKHESQFSKAFPALGSISMLGMNPQVDGGQFARIPSFIDAHAAMNRTISGDEFESPIFPWLINIARTRHGFDRLSAASLLSMLKKYSEAYPSDESPKNRERALAFLVVPLLVNMIQEAAHSCDTKNKSPPGNAQQRVNDRKFLEQAQIVLADLIEGSPALQKAAVDARAIPTLCTILKRSFDPVAASSKPLWSPRTSAEDVIDPDVDPGSSTLGRPGLSSELLHALRYREGALRSIAALTDREDAYRKVVIENGAVACITEALVPYPSQELEESNAKQPGPKDGNPIPVLIAACWAARSMSRSVSILRTSLIDYGVAKPIHGLLTHPNVEVQIAATEVLCNLVLHFSPMRDSLIEAGSLKTICEHAHSANSRMRLNSLWALKHMVLTATNDIKTKCLDELGTGWLIRTIQGEQKDYAGPPSQSHVSTAIGMRTPNAAGEQVDLLNAVDEPSMEIDESSSSSGDEDEDNTPEVLRRPPHRALNSSTIRSELKAIKQSEQDPRLRAEHDDLRIQEQALDFIRNLIAESKAGAAEMIDHLLSTIGSTRFFEMMASKLRPTSSSSPSTIFPPSPARTRSPLSNPRDQGLTFGQLHFNQAVLAPPEILLSVVFILIHIANGRPQHRALLISQTQLLNHVLPLFQHPDRRLRVACVWLVINLTWMDDSSDMPAARDRALSLKALGVEQKVRELTTDQDLDTRERAKTAVEQMSKLLDGSGNGGPGLGLGGMDGGGFESRRPLGSGFGGARGWRGE
ncbi:ARM repeat-containing protein [Mytilinidion resinicola]|uniref:ARM repeat-containing protein n=1 Tax=Mytilinidion resinicola TaxID=574789 RepID=A0A6A6YSX0_9PEZI|nr:ARM repeat-containing protein [Mytilinidion resinicola]KAF2811658.1 ARM repeat-containing protein [Mytilinidion resinicola]